ncbi:MAG: UDP-4-amino-4,6-dideoxy-N-acetyl-beta-L-altrosamine transaminase [Gammaproteobacteria bacterium]|nr:UDP-4-amino-4,6-dideoxy-N-acetyl-beta-L-altrosamine transaminase [Gammaproteobacteria bacterium]
MKKIIPYAKQEISEDDIDSVIEVLKSDYLTQGSKVPEFEEQVARHLGSKYALACNSATSCLHISCLSLGLSQGDLLWTSPITYVASANCALYCGAEIDFVDIDPLTWNISPDLLEEKLKSAKKTGKIPKVLVIVHLAGNPCDLKRIHQLSKEYNFFIIEDASHALGSKYSDKLIGSGEFSDLTILSFHAVKNITTAEGGMVLTNGHKLFEKLELLRSHGVTRDTKKMTNKDECLWYYEQLLLGFNFRMSEIHAALGISQMKSLDKFITKRNEIAQIYIDKLKDLPVTVQTIRKEDYSAWHIFVIHLKFEQIERSRLEIFNLLRSKGIGVNVHYIPVHLQPFYQKLGFKRGDFPNSENYYDGAITIPMFTKLQEKEIELVLESLKESTQ